MAKAWRLAVLATAAADAIVMGARGAVRNYASIRRVPAW
jgi:hypothetical protein